MIKRSRDAILSIMLASLFSIGGPGSAAGETNLPDPANFTSIEKVRRMMATYHAIPFINHDKAQADIPKLLPAVYD